MPRHSLFTPHWGPFVSFLFSFLPPIVRGRILPMSKPPVLQHKRHLFKTNQIFILISTTKKPTPLCCANKHGLTCARALRRIRRKRTRKLAPARKYFTYICRLTSPCLRFSSSEGCAAWMIHTKQQSFKTISERHLRGKAKSVLPSRG